MLYLPGNSKVHFRFDFVVSSYVLVLHLFLILQVTCAPQFVSVEAEVEGGCLWLPHLHILIVCLDRHREQSSGLLCYTSLIIA